MDSDLGTRNSESCGVSMGTAVTQLQDIKEEEDLDIIRLQSSGNDSSSNGESEMSGGKAVDEKVEYRVSGDSSRASSGDKEKQAVVGGSTDDLSLLPPLPNTFERVLEDGPAQQGLEQELEPHEAAGQFDLSKALEIPMSYVNNGESSTVDNGGSDSSLSLTPRLTSPKLSLKKKFSNATPVTFPTQREGSPGESYETRAHSIRSKSNSNAAAFQHILPALNLAIDGTANEHFLHQYHYHYQPRVSQDRKSSRKFSFGDSSSENSNGSMTDAELLYRMPPPSLNRTSNSRSRSNSGVTASFDALTNPTTAMNTPTTSLLDGEPGMKKVPLLRRASSAILRKASIRGKTNTLRSSSASTTPILQNKPFFEAQRTPPNATRYCGSILDDDNNNSDDDLQYVTQIDDSSRPCSRNPSIRSRVRKGFSRIMSSSGSVRRATSSASLRDVDAAEDVSTTPVTGERPRYEFQVRSSADDPSGLSSPLESRRMESVHSGTPVSASTFLSPVASITAHVTDQRLGMSANSVGYRSASTVDNMNLSGKGTEKDGETGSASTAGESKVCKKDQSGDEDIGDDVTVDLDKLTQSIPVITVTDNLSSKNGSEVQVQSNITLDDVYRGKNYKNYRKYIGGTRDKDNDSRKPEMMTLREYVEILVKQQQVEDERLAILEKNFGDSGWCSREDLMNLQQKRIIISKKWAERISFYQNKLEH